MSETLQIEATARDFDFWMGSWQVAVRYIWSGVTTRTPRWEQAFSDDGGRTWETNWVMDFTPAEGGSE